MALIVVASGLLVSNTAGPLAQTLIIEAVISPDSYIKTLGYS